jgi:hypothetical protein
MSWFEKFLSITRLQWTQRFSVMLLIGVVPIVMMWHVLFVDQAVHLANPGPLPFASAVTDLDGAARFAYLLSDMTYPWSNSTFISSPVGASLWRLETFSQLLQTLFLWFSAKVVPPMLAANLLIFLGWYGTGLVVYLIYRRCGGSKWIALTCVFAVQLLPSMRFMAANFTSYVAVGIPLLVVLTTIVYFQSRTFKNLLLICGALLINALHDPYWFMFSAFVVTIMFTLLFISRGIQRQNFLLEAMAALSGIALLFLFTALPALVNRREGRSDTRTIDVADISWVRAGLMPLETWNSSIYMGVGGLGLIMGVIVLFLFAVMPFPQERILLIYGLMFFLLSSTFTIPNIDSQFALAELARHWMPGVRFFDRASLIALALLLILIFRGTEILSSKFRDTLVSSSLIAASMTLALTVGYPSLEIPAASNSYNDWVKIRNILNQTSEPKVLALPFNRYGRDWIEQGSLQVPFANDLSHPQMDLDTLVYLSRGADKFSSYLQENNITHVISVDELVDSDLKYALTEPHFREEESIVLWGFNEVADIEATLYSVVPNSSSFIACTLCTLGPMLSSRPSLSGIYFHPPDTLPNGQTIWWLTGGSSDLTVRSLGKNITNLSKSIRFQIDLAPCANSALLVVSAGHEVTRVQLTSSQRTKTFTIDTDQINEITITASGSTCKVPTDPRPLLVQLSSIQTE